MKSQVALWKVLAQDMGERCRTSTKLDCKTVELRHQSEGLSFLTITLPTFAKDLEIGLSRGQVAHDLWKSFHFQGGLPVFLRGFLEQIFDARSGTLLEYPSVAAIMSVRQLCYFMGKIEIPCAPKRVASALGGYIECEQELQAWARERTTEDYSAFSRASRVLFGDVFSDLERSVRDLDLIPKHGPGATAARISGNGKFTAWTWTKRLEEVFPYGEFLLPSWRFRKDVSVEFLEPGAEPPVRVITVPKTLKTPRIIAIEPVHTQYMQQALLRAFLEALRGKLADDFLGFDDQLPNRQLAKEGSRYGHLATLDLSEASDRVSNQLVQTMLLPYRLTSRAVQATRSTHADVPGHGVIRLTKFASMGSALCFPFEAMVFLTCVFLGIAKASNVPLTRSLVERYRGQVRVFGDDIIVPVDFVRPVVETLNLYGAKVNSSKSFWTGRFRESCGGDYYDGHDISIVRQRQLLPSSRGDVAELVSTVAMRNLMANRPYQERRYPRTVAFLDELLGNLLPHFPEVHPTSPVLGRHVDPLLEYQVDRMCERLHRPLVKGYVIVAKPPSDYLDGVAALTKVFIKQGLEPLPTGHLERSGRPRAVSIKPRWTTPY